MSKIKRKTFGNEKLDKMKEPLSERQQSLMVNKKVHQSENYKIQILLAINYTKTLEALLDHYKIDKEDPERWFLLCLHLANDYVPGMHFKKPSGAPKVWTLTDKLTLFAVIEKEKKTSGKSYKEIYGEVHKLVEGTILSRIINEPKDSDKKSKKPKEPKTLINSKTEIKTIKNIHNEFKNSDIFKIFKEFSPAIFESPKFLLEEIAAAKITTSESTQ